MLPGFSKITPVNGFDRENPDNARQNNYAWSMAEFGDYIYVGTGRNIVYSFLASGAIGNIKIPEYFTPKKVDMSAEIWRYRKNGCGQWERVYKAPKNSGIMGFRFMIPFTDKRGQAALYVGCFSSLPQIILLRTVDGELWESIDTKITTGNSTRSMIVHGNKLYMSVVSETGEVTSSLIYSNSDPKKDPWILETPKGEEGKNPRGQVVIMSSYNNHIYAATARTGGFEVWRTIGSSPEINKWKLVVDKGAGDALNENPLTMGIFRGYLYVGTASFIFSFTGSSQYGTPKPFDLIRLDYNDKWELVIGGTALKPTNPTTGIRDKAISGYRSGFGVLTNNYCWQLQEYNGELYLGTFDSSVLIPLIYETLLLNKEEALKKYDSTILRFLIFNPLIITLFILLISKGFGFDLYKSSDGVHFKKLSDNGLDNPANYGVRMFLKATNGRLYLGTANPFEGCEIWVK